MPRQKFEIRELHEGDLVEFQHNAERSKFGVVVDGFGMDPTLSGSKIFGSFGATAEKAVENFKKSLEHKKKPKEPGVIADPIGDAIALPDDGYTHRQQCKIVGHVDMKTGEWQTNLVAKGTNLKETKTAKPESNKVQS